MSLWKAYLRWRHSKGFGVHSPYAYEFVSAVVRHGPYRFYSFDETERHLSREELDDHKFIRSVRFMIRLLNFLAAKRIVTSEGTKRLSEVTALSMKQPYLILRKDKHPDFKKGDVLIGTGGELPIPILRKAIELKIPIFILEPDGKTRKFLAEPIERGILFNDPRKMILVPRDEMAYVAYDINLRNSAFDSRL